MLIVGLDAALAGCSAAVLRDGVVLGECEAFGARGQGGALAGLLWQALDSAGVAPGMLDAVAVSTGPGGFTGVRAALALAQGFALALGREPVGVSLAEAFADAYESRDRPLWTAIDARHGRVFLGRAGTWTTHMLESLPPTGGPVALAGDAADEVAARLTARGELAYPTGLRQPRARHVAGAGARRLGAANPPGPALPIYLDAPLATRPAGGLRPSPA